MLSKHLLPLWALLIASFSGIAAVQGQTAAGSHKNRPQYYPIIGTQSGVDSQTGARPFRRNILDLQNDTPAW